MAEPDRIRNTVFPIVCLKHHTSDLFFLRFFSDRLGLLIFHHHVLILAFDLFSFALLLLLLIALLDFVFFILCFFHLLGGGAFDLGLAFRFNS